MEKVSAFNIIGISVRTTNENNEAAIDIPALWNKFMTEGIAAQIPNKIDNNLYCIYTEYEKDFTKPYTTILGCKVENLSNVPAGMKGVSFPEASYQKFIAKGNILEGMVFHEWNKIWNKNLNRSYAADFEVYGEKANDPADAEVDIFIAIKE